MTKSLTLVICGVAVAALALAAWRFDISSHGTTSPSVVNVMPDAPTLGEQPKAGTNTNGVTEKPAIDKTKVGKNANEVDHLKPSSNNKATDESLSRSRRPFRLSSSVAMECSASTEPHPPCEDVYPQLARLSRESRDPAWAPAMERQLRDNFHSDPHGLKVRAVECRRTLCAAEVATYDSSYTGPTSAFLVDNGLFVGTDDGVGAMFGYEVDAGGAKEQITVMIFVRR